MPTIDNTALRLSFDEHGEPVAALTAPDDEATIAYLARLRDFDNPRASIYVAKFLEILEDGASVSRRAVEDHLRRAHRDLGREPLDRPDQLLGPGATPRDVWELWTYSHLIHLDENKRAKWAALQPWERELAKFAAYWCAGDLYHLVAVIEAMLRDRNLDGQGVRTQVLTINPTFAARAPASEAAKVRYAWPDRSPIVR